MSTGEYSSRKRPRVDGDEPPDDPIFVEHQDVWMDDGNVVISAGDKPTYLFKCHRSVLSKHSEVFERMLGIPPSTAPGEQYQGLPRVHLTDDADDVRRLLKILYDATLIPREAAGRTTCEEITGPMRLAKKYMIGGLYDHLLFVLERDWPSNYEEYGAIQMVMAKRCVRSDEEMYDLALAYRDPAPAVALARELGLGTVYTIAMYELTKWLPTWEEDYNASFDIPLRVREELLSREDFRTLMVAHQRMRFTFASVLAHLEKAAILNCPHSARDLPQCPERMTRWLQAVINLILPNLQTLGWNEGPLQGLVTVKTALLRWSTNELTPIEGLPPPRDLCEDCRIHIAKQFDNASREFWGKLPEIFGG